MLIFALPYFRHTLQANAFNSFKNASVIGSVGRPLYGFLATFGDLGWGKAEGRGQKAEVGRKKDII
ncbi:hypothetical protein, partial [Nostoc sp.]|uniref:hypothetical protein n=1 Tax=Nostoc sp. TaxID=1180 RepID=UPI002FF141A8